MPLLCISLFALLLLPQSLSCGSKNSVTKVKKDYIIVKVDLDNTSDEIWEPLKRINCPEMKTQPENCTSSSDELITLTNLVCKLKTFGLSQTKRLIDSVAGSVGCPCNTTTAMPEASTTVRTARLRKDHHERRTKNREKRVNRRLCKASAILSSIRECYEILNTRPSPTTS